MKVALLCVLTFISFNPTWSAPTTSIPRIPAPVHLGYPIHDESFHNITAEGRIIKFYPKICFPDLPGCFQKPKFPPSRLALGGIQRGNYTHDTRCVSAIPQGVEVLFSLPNGTAFGFEDCLVLDVHFPTSISCAEGDDSKPGPVIHWLYGGGYSFGSKEMFITPLGLFD